MLDGSPSPYGAIYGAYLDKQRSIRTARHKLIIYPKANAIRLYDVKADPLEMHDLAGSAKHSKTMTRLFKRLKKMQADLKDTVDLGEQSRYKAHAS